jgi:hypothetical protein
MAKRKKKFFYEPWVAARAPITLLDPPPPPDHYSDADKRQMELDWKARNAKLEQNAEWILWGSGMKRPGFTQSLTGKLLFLDDHGYVAAIRKSNAWPEKGPDHSEVAVRIAECVNACAGIKDPQDFVAGARELLLEMAKAEKCDKRVTKLIAMCAKPKEKSDG